MKKAIEKYVDFNDLDKVIGRNKNGCFLKKGADKFIKTRIKEGYSWDMDDMFLCYVENIPQVKTRKKLLETGIGELIRSEDIGFAEGWCLYYNDPFCDGDGIVTPYLDDECYAEEYGGKVRISHAIEEMLPRTAILKELIT